MLRTYFEKLTDVFTGSDGDLNYTLHQSLQHCGFTAEAHIDNVWIVKTHYPLGKDKTVTAKRVICCVRNPLDVVTSMFNFWSTQTQNLSCDADFSSMSEWDALIKQEITLWRDFHKYWISTNSVYFLRFEDLLSDPKTTLEGIFKHLLEAKSLEGTEILLRIDKLAEEQVKPQLYKPRKGQINKNNEKFANHMQFISDTLGDLVSFF